MFVSLKHIELNIQSFKMTKKKDAKLESAFSSMSDCRFSSCEFRFQQGHVTSLDADHELLFAGILPLLLIKE